MITLKDCRALDAADPLAHLRAEFELPPDTIYLDGNSLGPPRRTTSAHVERIVREEWGRQLIGGWNQSWWDMPVRLGAMLAPLVGAHEDEVIVTDTISINLFKLIAAALPLAKGRRVILSDGANFPTDRYVAEGLAKLVGGLEHRIIPTERSHPSDAFADDVAVAVLSHVDYRTGRILDMEAITERAQTRGIKLVWDLAHSAGVMPVELNRAGAEFAVGCTYKYLNGGPGAPAFLYVRRDLHDRVSQPLSGWFGHADPFAFEEGYRPAAGMRRFLTGTHSALAMGALEASLELWRNIDLDAVRAKSLSLTSLFIDLMRDAPGLTLLTPQEPARRGGHVAYHRTEDGYAIIQALIARGVIGDFRAPGLLRFGFAPLTLSHEDVWRAARHFREVLESGEYRQDRFRRAAPVT